LYQWRKNGASIPGATNFCLSLDAVQLSDGGSYSVAVANDYGAALSDSAVLTISYPQVPPGDNFVDRVPIFGTNGIISGTNNGATREPGEPIHADKMGNSSVWYTWQAPASGIATFGMEGSSFDTLLAIYSGSSLSNLIVIAADDDTGGAFTSQAQFNAVAGTDYQIAIDAYGPPGAFILNWQLEITTNHVPVITTKPDSATVAAGATHTFSVTILKRIIRHDFQWFFNGTPIPGETNKMLTVTNININNVGSYFVRITAGGAETESDPVSLQINLTGSEVQPVFAFNKFLDAVNATNVLLLGTPPSPAFLFSIPGGRSRSSALAGALAAGYTGAQVFNNYGASSDSGEEIHCSIICGVSEWIPFVAQEPGVLYVNTDGSKFDTVLAIYTPSNNAYARLACDDNSGLGGTNSSLGVSVPAGQTNFIVVDGKAGAIGPLVVNYSLVTSSTLLNLGRNIAGLNRIRVTGHSGMRFTLLQTIDFRTWLPVTTLRAPVDGPNTLDYLDTSSANVPFRFYRALMLP
jgi:hypothetical protein